MIININEIFSKIEIKSNSKKKKCIYWLDYFLQKENLISCHILNKNGFVCKNNKSPLSMKD